MNLKKLVTVENLFLAEVIKDFLEKEGIPVVIKRTKWFDNPYFGSSGPRDLFVEEEKIELAKNLLENFENNQ
ncbi:MAG TPA: DUF2007 domain-containing protein [Caldisericia bacterium]|nr:DUF2007 domain-containing protein [Caldisericia bacterium]